MDALSRSIQGTNDRIGSEVGRLDGRVSDVGGNLNAQVGRLDGRINDTAGYIDRVNGSIEQVKTNIYYPGTTVIDGGKIMTGSIQVGGNLLKNPSFQNDLWGWTQGSFASIWRVPSSEPYYSAPGTLGLNNTARDARYAFSDRFDIREGTTYEISAWLASHRGGVGMWLDYFDASGKWISNSGGVWFPFDSRYDASSGDRWRFAVHRHAAPSGARSACLVLHSPGYTEGSDTWIWVNRPQVCVAGGSSYPALWSPGTTFIDGSQIKAGSITADRLSAAYLTVGTNVADLPGSLDKSRVVGDFSDRVTVIDGGKISTGTVSADKLTITTPNLVSNPELTGGSGWTHNGVVQAEQFGSGAPTRTALRWQQRDFQNDSGRTWFPDGAVLTVTVFLNGAATNAKPLNIGVRFDNNQGNYDWRTGLRLNPGALQAGRWQRYSLRVTVPTGKNWGCFWMNQDANDGFTELFVAGVSVTQGETYIDGAQISTGTIKAERLDLSGVLRVGTTVDQLGGTLTQAQLPQIGNDKITTIDGGKITTGTLDAYQVNIINLNANNITTGALMDPHMRSFIDLDRGTFRFGEPNGNRIEWSGNQLQMTGPLVYTGNLQQNSVSALQKLGGFWGVNSATLSFTAPPGPLGDEYIFIFGGIVDNGFGVRWMTYSGMSNGSGFGGTMQGTLYDTAGGVVLTGAFVGAGRASPGATINVQFSFGAGTVPKDRSYSPNVTECYALFMKR